MADETQETKASQQEPSVSYEDLERAAADMSEEDGVTQEGEPAEEGIEEETVTEPGQAEDNPEEDEGQGEETGVEETEQAIKPEPDGNAERSRLGRKVKSLEETVQALMQKLETVAVTDIKAPEEKIEAEEEEEFIPTTKKELEEFLEHREERKKKQNIDYETKYIAVVNNLGLEEDDTAHEAIVEEMMKNFNVRYSNDPARDAEINYLKAERAYLKKQMAAVASTERTNPLKGNGKPVPVGGDTKVTKKKVALPKLDKYAEEFARDTGMTEDDLRRYLG